jgi:membrane protease YdiL (CAAX protease family)
MMSTTFEQPPKSRRPEVPAASTRPAFITRHAVLTYYAIAFAISWGAILLAVGPDGWFGTGATIVVAGSVSLAGPSIAGVLMTGLADGRAGFRLLVSRLRRWRVRPRWYAVALLTGPLVMCGTVLGLSLASPEFRRDILTADNKLSTVLLAIAGGLMIGVFEELGWTGFALPRLRRPLQRSHHRACDGSAMGRVALPILRRDHGSDRHRAARSRGRGTPVRVATSVQGAHGMGL